VIKIADMETEYFNKYGPHFTPAVVINNQTFRGQLEVETVFNAICAGFYTVPDYCKRYLETNDVNNPELVLMQTKTVIKHSYQKVLRICIVLVAVILVIMCLYRRSAKRNM
jgi:TctA family transporter